LLIVGCLAPLVLAKPKTNYIEAIGKGTVIYGTTTVPAGIALSAFVTLAYSPEGSIVYEGIADVVIKFVLPDGTKITAVKQIPTAIAVTDDGFTLAFVIQGNWVDVPITVIKNKIYGTLTAEGITINPELTVDINFYLRRVEIKILTAEGE